MINQNYSTIDEYISLFPKDIQKILDEMRRVIKKTIPDSEEAIRYRMPTFRLGGKNLVHFAKMKNHVGFYPTSSPIVAFRKELSLYKTSKGAIQFPDDKPIPFDLVQKIVRFRLNEVKDRYIK